MRNNMNLLQKERIHLLDEYMNAKGSEKVRLLVRIMDIDEQLEITKRQEALANRKQVG
ncbi:MAG TPA: hypothetical protein GX504_09945 [Clostridia bacterium]|nr:hypothetical protein [Clostridia bacterium]